VGERREQDNLLHFNIRALVWSGTKRGLKRYQNGDMGGAGFRGYENIIAIRYIGRGVGVRLEQGEKNEIGLPMCSNGGEKNSIRPDPDSMK